ncbi:hypothetical protein B0T16DRAFT_459196 [Cercophora newfieldiana]|uniref:Uncharacterized protein n=1 Tax=Cercophora newfieldiana TaxID=92897 RepID=A0AA39Y173_9PEZI|nr:hypothetical protein B0T16DRAFT_459196 [Cercophora newfieldiana]
MSDFVSQKTQNKLPRHSAQELGNYEHELPYLTPAPSASQPDDAPGHPRNIRLAFQAAGNLFLYPTPSVLADQAKAAAMRDARALSETYGAAAHRAVLRWVSAVAWKMFRKTSIEEASVMVTDIDDVERGESSNRIVPCDRRPHPELTTLFHGHNIVGGTDNFAAQYPDVVTGATATKVLLVTSELRKRAVAWLFATILAVAVGGGVSIGVATSDWRNGAVFAGTLGTVSGVLLAMVIYLSKR